MRGRLSVRIDMAMKPAPVMYYFIIIYQVFFYIAKGVIIITSQPQDIDFDVDDEEKAVFNITAEGNEPLRFQWMKDDEPIEDKDNVEGTNGPKLIISHPTKVNEGQYHCIVSDDVGEKESQKVNLVLYIGIKLAT